MTLVQSSGSSALGDGILLALSCVGIGVLLTVIFRGFFYKDPIDRKIEKAVDDIQEEINKVKKS